MKNFFSLCLLLISSLFVTSCLEVIEEITIKKDGSGTYSSTVDASQMAEQMAMLGSMDTTGEMMPKMKFSMDSTFLSSFAQVSKVEGIKNFKVDTSKAYVYTYTVDFKDVATLNKIVAVGKSNSKVDASNLYSFSKGKISRRNEMANNSNSMMGDMGEQEEMAKTMLKDMKYTVIYHVPNKIKGNKNKMSVLSDDKKTLTLQCSMLDIVEGKAKLEDEVKFK